MSLLLFDFSSHLAMSGSFSTVFRIPFSHDFNDLQFQASSTTTTKPTAEATTTATTTSRSSTPAASVTSSSSSSSGEYSAEYCLRLKALNEQDAAE